MNFKSFCYVVIWSITFNLPGGLFITNHSWSAAQENSRYGYYYKEQLIVLKPSPHLIALEEHGPSVADAASTSGLVRDKISEKHAVKSNGFGIYRLPAARSRDTSSADVSSRIPALRASAQAVVQPVFEQGDFLLIPNDEVIICFNETTSLEQAESFLSSYLISQGIRSINSHRKNTFIIQIDDPSDGRIYAVSRFFAQLEEIRFAEPNHIMARQDAAVPDHYEAVALEDVTVVAENPGMSAADSYSPLLNDPLLVAPSWTTLFSENFEGSFPPPGWSVWVQNGKTDARWGKTSHRSYDGSASAHCAAAGTAGISPPADIPLNMFTGLKTSNVNLSGYEEVYIEAWFYAVNDLWPGPGGSLYDYPIVIVFNANTGNGVGTILGSLATGDLTQDPTTDNGWRRVLWRVPPDYRVANAYFEFRYVSDSVDRFEGAYIDSVRIVGTTDVDTQPIGNDTYGARQYELRNVGQVAGLGNDFNDLHVVEAWGLVSVSPNVVVAVIDTGVDLTHPDLNLVQGYDHDGTVGGGPKDLDPQFPDNHGTACAGNVGAIRNNDIGVAGTAPGVKIMPIHWGTTFADLAASIDVAVANGADILSNSWGWVGSPSTIVETAIDDALADGRIVVQAAGNGPDRPPWGWDVAFPGNTTDTKDIITVGASSLTDEHKATASSDGQFRWGSSFMGPGPDVLAPGPWSYTTDRQGSDGYNDGTALSSADYDPTFGGTSSSTPKVAGIVALMLSVNPNLTPAQVKSILRATADDVDSPGVDDKTGAGRVNAYQALRAIVGGGEGAPIGALYLLFFP